MKICWDNLEKLIFVKASGCWRKGWYYFEYAEACAYCGDPCLVRSDKANKDVLPYCDRTCQIKCSKQRKKQGISLSNTWKNPDKRKKMILNTEKAVQAWKKKRRQEVALLDKDKKTCSMCEEERLAEDFTKDARLLTGLASACKYCKREQYTKWTGYSGVQQLRNEYMRNKEKTEPKFKLRMRMSNAIYQSIVGDKGGRSWESLVGYTLNDLKLHIGKQFQLGMAWKNYGKWHIDHKVPISAFNFTKPEHEDFKHCWSLENLQPLWAKDNLSKGAKLQKPFQPSLLLEAA